MSKLYRRGIACMLTLPLVAMILSACGTRAASSPIHRVHPPATPTPTATVGFAVAVNSASPTPVRARPTALPTRINAHGLPYLILAPSSGAPVSRRVTVHAGNLPARSGASLSWVSSSGGQAVTTDTMTGPSGDLNTSFLVPAAPPGLYRVLLQVGGVTVARANYRVASRARVTVSIHPSTAGDTVTVAGAGFVPYQHLLLLAYAVVAHPKPVVLGRVRSNRHGIIHWRQATNALAPGSYTLRVWSTEALAAQMADTFFEVVA